MIRNILDSPWYVLLFGSGGALIVVISIIELLSHRFQKRNRRMENEGQPQMNNRSSSNNVINIHIDTGVAQSDTHDQKKQEADDNTALDQKQPYEDGLFDSANSQKFVDFLAAVTEKKKPGDMINYDENISASDE